MATLASKMPYSRVGSAGLKVSRLSFGSWVTFHKQTDINLAYELMKFAYENGVNFFDNAEGYENGKSETVMGESIKRGIKEGVWEREDLVIATKIFFGYKKGVNNIGLSRKHIIEGTKRSLERLQLSYVDVLFCHRPDLDTPIEETVRAMNFVIEQGWAFYWGTSEWSTAQLLEAHAVANRLNLIPPQVEQPEYNLFKRDRMEVEYKPLFEQYGLGTTIWSPLASGILTGKYAGFQVPAGSRLSLDSYEWLRKAKMEANKWQIEKTELLRPIAEELGCKLSQLAIAWCLANKDVSTVILGATSIAQLKENLESLEILPKLTPELLKRIDELLETKPVLDKITLQVTAYRATL